MQNFKYTVLSILSILILTACGSDSTSNTEALFSPEPVVQAPDTSTPAPAPVPTPTPTPVIDIDPSRYTGLWYCAPTQYVNDNYLALWNSYYRMRVASSGVVEFAFTGEQPILHTWFMVEDQFAIQYNSGDIGIFQDNWNNFGGISTPASRTNSELYGTHCLRTLPPIETQPEPAPQPEPTTIDPIVQVEKGSIEDVHGNTYLCGTRYSSTVEYRHVEEDGTWIGYAQQADGVSLGDVSGTWTAQENRFWWHSPVSNLNGYYYEINASGELVYFPEATNTIQSSEWCDLI